jgi:hypothetical protein
MRSQKGQPGTAYLCPGMNRFRDQSREGEGGREGGREEGKIKGAARAKAGAKTRESIQPQPAYTTRETEAHDRRK